MFYCVTDGSAGHASCSHIRAGRLWYVEFALHKFVWTDHARMADGLVGKEFLRSNWDAIAVVLLRCIDDSCQSIVGDHSTMLGPRQRTVAAELCEALIVSLHQKKNHDDKSLPSEYNKLYRALLSRLDDSNDSVRLAVLQSLREYLPLLEVGQSAAEPAVIEVTGSEVDLDVESRACPEFGNFLRSCLVQLRIGESSNSDAFNSLMMDMMREAAPKDTETFLKEVRHQNDQRRTNDFEDLIDHADLINSLKSTKR